VPPACLWQGMAASFGPEYSGNNRRAPEKGTAITRRSYSYLLPPGLIFYNYHLSRVLTSVKNISN